MEKLKSSNKNTIPVQNEFTGDFHIRRNKIVQFDNLPDKTDVNPNDYKFIKYTQKDDLTGSMETSEWAEKYVQRTANVISMLDGSNELGIKPDAAIFLDKSARPVAGFVNMFWHDFAQKDSGKPSQSFLNIDRVRVFNFFEKIVDGDGRFSAGHEKVGELARPRDFLEYIDKNQNNPKFQESLNSLKSAVRSQYVLGEIPRENSMDYILNSPTSLDGKSVMIIDEVERTGSTLFMAETLLKMAIPEIKEINSTTFWGSTTAKTGHILNFDGTIRERKMGGVPIWYDRSESTGRGVGDHSQYYYDVVDEKFQTPTSLKLKIGAAVLSAPHFRHVSGEQRYKFTKDEKFVKLMQDVRQLRKDYRKGKIKFVGSKEWNDDRYEDFLNSKNKSTP